MVYDDGRLRSDSDKDLIHKLIQEYQKRLDEVRKASLNIETKSLEVSNFVLNLNSTEIDHCISQLNKLTAFQ